MLYTVADAAKKAGLSPSALRYYDKEGLLPGVERTSGGARMFTDRDLAWLAVVERLKEAGLTIKEIRQYAQWAREGDATIGERRALLHARKAAVEEEIAKLQRTLRFVTYKCWFYDEAERLGSEEAVRALPDAEVPADMREIREHCLASSY